MRNRAVSIAMPISFSFAPTIENPIPPIQISTPGTQLFGILIRMPILCPSSIHVHAPPRASILSYWMNIVSNNFYAAFLNQVGVT